MNTIASIFGYLFLFIIGIFVLMIFIQTFSDLWKEVGMDWWKTTKVGMKINNKRNNVKVLTNEEYENILYGGMIKSNIILDKE